MKRRKFIATAALGAGALAAGCSSMAKTSKRPQGNHALLHPFVREHPEAVFINLTNVKSKADEDDIRAAAFGLAKDIFVKAQEGPATRITCKPNWTCNPLVNGKDSFDQRGINTDKNYIEGFLRGVREVSSPKEVIIHECACPEDWEAHGWPQMAKKNGFALRDLTSKNFWELRDGLDLKFKKVDNGIVFKEIAFQVPMTEPDTYLVNIAKFKAHGMGMTSSIKNLQGISGKMFHQMCGGFQNIFNSYDKRYHPFFRRDYFEHVRKLTAQHVKAGIPRWEKPGEKDYAGGFYMEQWVERMLDSLSATPTGINMVEGVYGRDGNGFDGGPHDGKAMDYMANNVIFGLDPFRVDIITHWLAGHEPGNFGLFHIGIERGMSNVLDPHDIPIYLWENGKATQAKLDSFKRTPLVTYYMQRNWGGQNEPYYHLCDEPFDYSAWKVGKKTAERPSIRGLGTDSRGGRVMEVSLPERDDIYVDVLDRHGRVVWRLKADGLEPGVHQVVWDGFNQPGMYNVYVKGMGWDAVRGKVVYS
jgi:hypothetical protein